MTSVGGTPDISMSAAVNGAAILYLSFPGATPGFHLVGRTREASPLFSGVVAVADQTAHRNLGLLNRRCTASATAVARGSTTSSVVTPPSSHQHRAGPRNPHTVKGFKADRGYDLGTADGQRLVGQLSRGGRF